jgi:hypothetical protein
MSYSVAKGLEGLGKREITIDNLLEIIGQLQNDLDQQKRKYSDYKIIVTKMRSNFLKQMESLKQTKERPLPIKRRKTSMLNIFGDDPNN